MKLYKLLERDYKDEYKKFQSSKKMKKYRAELNKYNKDKGTYGNGDKKDATHKNGKICGFENQSKNRGRKEKSRLKKIVESIEAMGDLYAYWGKDFELLDKETKKKVKKLRKKWKI